MDSPIAAKQNTPEHKKGNGKPWPKGTSGNPKGRKKVGDTAAEIAREILSATSIEYTLQTLPSDKNPTGRKQIQLKSSCTIGHAIVAGLAAAAMGGDIQAAKELHDRAYGKAGEKIDLNQTNSGETKTVVHFHIARKRQETST